MEEKPTIVLIHGAFADASGFAGIIKELEAAGYPVVAMPNPLRSLITDAESVAVRVKAINRPVVLVGHSYGGAVIGQAAAELDNVKALVFLAGFGLDVGENVASILERFKVPAPAGTSYEAPGAPGGPDLYVGKDIFHKVFCADVPEDLAEVMAVSQRPVSVAAVTEKATAAGWKNIPTWYLISDQDNMVPTAAAEFMAERMKATTEHIDGSHVAFIAQPTKVAAFIKKAINSL